MKRVQGQSTKNAFEVLSFDVLTSNEMNQVRGGVEPPRSRDKDIYDFDEE
ncbi:hypothetical protein [uncultured Draconibacterium sp.]